MFQLREHPDKLIAILIVFGLTLLCSLSLFHNLFVGLIACVFVAGSVKEYLFPMRYCLSEQSIQVKCGPFTWLELSWENVRTVYRTAAGLKLSPYSDPTTARLEQLRGVTLRFPRAMAADVEAFVDQCRARCEEVQN